jgi:hypothetical protein
MDIDHEAHKHGVPPSTVKGEAERATAEDPSEQIQEVLDDAKDAVEDDGFESRKRPAEPGGANNHHAQPNRDDAPRRADRSERDG